VLGPSRVLSLYICLCETPFSFNLIPNYLCLILLYLLPILTILIAIDCQLIEAAPFVPEDTLPPLSIEPQPEGTPDSQVAEIALGGGQFRRLVHTSTGRVYEIPNEPNEAPIMGHFQTTLDAQLAAAAAQENARTNSNPRNRNDDGPFIPPNPAQVELLRRVAARPPVSSNIATKVTREVRALMRQTRDPRLALSTLKDNFRGFLARTRGDKAVVAHEYLHQFMVQFQYVVPRVVAVTPSSASTGPCATSAWRDYQHSNHCCE
jgi:hypothetical protein